MGKKASGTGDVLGTSFTDMIINNHDVETTVKPNVSTVLKYSLRITDESSLMASAVGDDVGMSIVVGVVSSDTLGYSKVGVASRFFEGDVGMGTAVMNVA